MVYITERIRKFLYTIWTYIASIWHGYEIVGIEKLRRIEKGGALLIFYHGATPIDMMYFAGNFSLMGDNKIKLYADRTLFKVAGWKNGLKFTDIFTGDFLDVIHFLKEGCFVILSPGGMFEAQFGDHYYKRIWKSRTGFARAALEAKVPIVPVFTQNIMEAFRTCKFGRVGWFLKMYDKWKLPLVPVFGGFPVKLRTIIGDPIPYDPKLTPEQLAQKTAVALDSLILEHQRIPGSIPMALLDRIWRNPKLKSA